MKVIEFCSNCSKCPVVEIHEDKVVIGEEGNAVSLELGQFEDLKKAIKEDRF